ncbi:3147_t:CDS:2, partial [Acaulospora colombiana]
TLSGYLGASLLLQDKNFVLATSSILSNLARHESSVNVLNGGSYSPQPFDLALRPEQVLSVVSPYISDCELDIAPLKPLKVTNELRPGALIQFDKSGLPRDGP